MTFAKANSTAGEAPARVLVVDDHASARASMADVLHCAGLRVECCASVREATAKLETEAYDLVLTDLQMPGLTGLDLVRHIAGRRLGVQVVVVTAHASIGTAVEAMRHGAFDYLEKPFDADQLEQTAARAIARGRLLDRQSPLGEASADEPAMIGSSRAMAALRRQICQLAPTAETVLIAGESGSGKELVARAIHAASRRSEAPLVSLNCPVLSAQLLESELFGHEKGAFTGAEGTRVGRFELADGGTILLDEISEIEPGLQAKLLRVLQERSFERVGSSRTIRVDVRVLATTNRDLRAEIAAGRFREDLYFRLAVVPVAIPPLRERREDIPELVDFFLRRAAARLEQECGEFEPGAMQLLQGYSWPGNVRELENLVTRACVLRQSPTIVAEEIRPWLLGSSASDKPGSATPQLQPGASLEQMERTLIEATLERFGGHRAKTAQALGIGLRTLSGKLKSYGYGPREKSSAKAA